jgi:hypothetical protein
VNRACKLSLCSRTRSTGLFRTGIPHSGSSYFIKAFPGALSEAEEIRFLDPEDTVRSCFSLCLLEHFCEYFGFLDTGREKKTWYRLTLHLGVCKIPFRHRALNFPYYLYTGLRGFNESFSIPSKAFPLSLERIEPFCLSYPTRRD